MSPEEIAAVLVAHALWLSRNPNGKRADLRGADLRGARLRGRDLRGADLRDARLRDARLRGADLRNTDLRGADLRGIDLGYADLGEADLRGAIGIMRLDMVDPREYQPVAVAHADGWRIGSGCRWLTVAQALDHWGPKYLGRRSIGDRYLRAIAALPPCPEVTP